MSVTLTYFVIISLAAFRLTRVITTDAIFESVRNKIWGKFPPSKGIGYLITCNWCTGFWVSALFVLMLLILPLPTLVVSLVLAISAVIGLLSTWIER
jgi:hypothetical protein